MCDCVAQPVEAELECVFVDEGWECGVGEPAGECAWGVGGCGEALAC